MKPHYSEEYCVKELIDKYCSEEWRFLMYENSEILEYDSGVRIFKEGEAAKRIKVLQKGKVKVHTTIGKGKEKIVRLAREKQILGHRAFGREFKYSVSATTLTECEILHIPTKIFLDLLKANNLFCFHFLIFFAEELKSSEQQLKLGGANNSQQRVAAAMLENIAAFGYVSNENKTLEYTLSRKDYAELANTTYESVVRVLKVFNEKGIIRTKKKKIEILDEERLIEISKLDF